MLFLKGKDWEEETPVLPKKHTSAKQAQLTGLDLKMQNIKCMCESPLNVEKSTYLQALVSTFSKCPKRREKVRIPWLMIDIAQPRSASSPLRNETGSFVFRVNVAQDNWGTVVHLLLLS